MWSNQLGAFLKITHAYKHIQAEEHQKDHRKLRGDRRILSEKRLALFTLVGQIENILH